MRILVVDDDKVWGTYASGELSAAFPEALVALFDSPEAALEKLTEETFDVVVVDYYMPHIDGLELVAKLRTEDAFKLNADTGIVFLSSYDSASMVADAIRAGADEYVVKNDKPADSMRNAVQRASVSSEARKGMPGAEAKSAAQILKLLASAQSLPVALLGSAGECWFMSDAMVTWLAGEGLKPDDLTLDFSRTNESFLLERVVSSNASEGMLLTIQ